MPRPAKMRSTSSTTPLQGKTKRTIYKALKDAGMTDIGFRLIVQNRSVAEAAVKAVQRHAARDIRHIRREILDIAKKHGLSRNEFKTLLRLE